MAMPLPVPELVLGMNVQRELDSLTIIVLVGRRPSIYTNQFHIGAVQGTATEHHCPYAGTS
jgi:hypothetical protein